MQGLGRNCKFDLYWFCYLFEKQSNWEWEREGVAGGDVPLLARSPSGYSNEAALEWRQELGTPSRILRNMTGPVDLSCHWHSPGSLLAGSWGQQQRTELTSGTGYVVRASCWRDITLLFDHSNYSGNRNLKGWKNDIIFLTGKKVAKFYLLLWVFLFIILSCYG